MKQKEIKVGGIYKAKVSNKIVSVKVTEIEESCTGSYKVGHPKPKRRTLYHVTNLSTGRKTTFRSASKFRSEVKKEEKKDKPNTDVILALICLANCPSILM